MPESETPEIKPPATYRDLADPQARPRYTGMRVLPMEAFHDQGWRFAAEEAVAWPGQALST